MKNISADTLAAAINNNCDAYNRGDIDRKAWSAEENRLWRLAAENFLLDREHGSAECAACFLSSLEHGRKHVPESFEHAYVVVGYRANCPETPETPYYQHVYTGVHEATSNDEALFMSERECAGRIDVDKFEVFYGPISCES